MKSVRRRDGTYRRVKTQSAQKSRKSLWEKLLRWSRGKLDNVDGKLLADTIKSFLV